MSSGHNKHKGFSQTSKRFEGALKAQHQQSHNKQLNPKRTDEEALPSHQKNAPEGSKSNRA